MAFQEFYCDPVNGSNMNGGSNDGAVKFAFAAGNWDGTSVYTAAGQDLSGIAVGDFAQVFNDGTTTPVYLARVTATDNGAKTITLSTTNKAGTAPTSGTGNRSINVGGYWKGPNGSQAFPLGFVVVALSTSAEQFVRVNLKDTDTYAITAAMTHSNPGICFQGYHATAGDGYRANIDGGTSGASYVLLTTNTNNVLMFDLIFSNNGASGSAALVDFSGGNCVGCLFSRVVFHDSYGPGLKIYANNTVYECEAYSCGKGAVTLGAFQSPYYPVFIRCFAHDCNYSNVYGFLTEGGTFVGCIAHNCKAGGFFTGVSAGNTNSVFVNCDSYASSAGAGFIIGYNGAYGATVLAENCNALKNASYGFWGRSSTGYKGGLIQNSGYGTGTQANATADTGTLGSIVASGAVSYGSNLTPWTDPANGDFRINLAAAKGAGRGSFTETAPSYTGSVAYKDIGSCQHTDSGGGGMLYRADMAGGMTG